MRRHRHRLSKDIDIFIDNPEFLGYLNPRLSDVAEALTTDYVEDTEYLKLRFPEGEIDLVVAAPLSEKPAILETVLARPFLVETSTEIVAKKIWHRGANFTARDIFDLAMVSEREPDALKGIYPILSGKREAVLKRIADSEPQLRETFNELLVLEYQRSFDECVEIVKIALAAARSTLA
jgi:Nucleotidyl transferase AbiEii toxin, Type IV TA system